MGCGTSTPRDDSPHAILAANTKVFPEPRKPVLKQISSIRERAEVPSPFVPVESPVAIDSPKPTARGKATTLDMLIANNREWARERRKQDPTYFERLCEQQAPEFLWIGCADSRVPANVIVGLEPGEVFCQRNVGNQAMHTDLNCQACIEYAVKELKVKTIIVCGHYGCGAIKAALRLHSRTPGLVNCWISDIRECRNQHQAELLKLSPEEQISKLCEYNVMRQTFHVCTSPAVQAAWDKGQELQIFGVCYSLKDGKMTKLVGPLAHDTDLGTHDPEAFLTISMATKPLETTSIAPSMGNLQTGDTIDNLDHELFPTEASERFTATNTATLASRLRAHASWTDLNAVNAHMAKEMAEMRASESGNTGDAITPRK